MPIFDLNRVVVVHANRTRPQVADALRHPLELAADRAIGQLALLYLDPLVELLGASCPAVALEYELLDEAFGISFCSSSFELYLERQTHLIVASYGFVDRLDLQWEMGVAHAPLDGVFVGLQGLGIITKEVTALGFSQELTLRSLGWLKHTRHP